MKSLLRFIPVLILLIFCIPMLISAENGVISITVSIPESAKIGESWDNVTPEIALTGTVDDFYSLSVDTDLTKFESSGYIRSTNNVACVVYLRAELNEDYANSEYTPEFPDVYGLDFIINEKWLAFDEMFDCVQHEKYNGFDYIVIYIKEMNISLTGRTTYPITADTTLYRDCCGVNIENTPTEAEAGAKVKLSARLEYKYDFDPNPFELDYFTVNGTRVPDDGSFIMPQQAVTVGAKITDKYVNSKFISEINISLDFKNEDIFYGKKLPTSADLFNALSATSNISGLDISIDEDFVNVDTLVGDNGEYEPWVGNTMLSFHVKAPDGYVFANPYITDYIENDDGTISNPKKEWLDSNMTVKVNGVETHFMVAPNNPYANGYIISEYYCGADYIEIHILWFSRLKINEVDLSNVNADQLVDLSNIEWTYDGYRPTGYYIRTKYYYETDIDTTDNWYYRYTPIIGKSFTMPELEANQTDPVVVAYVIRGAEGMTAQKIETEANDYLNVNTDNADFGDDTVVFISKIREYTEYGDENEDYIRIKEALAELANDSILFDISASSYNQKIQPNGTVLVTFTLPSGYDNDHIAFYYVDEDGNCEKITAQYDTETGICTALLEHFSSYAIVSTKETSTLPSHVIHDLTLIPEKMPTCTENGHCKYYTCSGCDKYFSDAKGENEITDKNSITSGYEAKHNFENGTCKECGAADPDYTPSAPTGDSSMVYVIVTVMMLSAFTAAIVSKKQKR